MDIQLYQQEWKWEKREIVWKHDTISRRNTQFRGGITQFRGGTHNFEEESHNFEEESIRWILPVINILHYLYKGTNQCTFTKLTIDR